MAETGASRHCHSSLFVLAYALINFKGQFFENNAGVNDTEKMT